MTWASMRRGDEWKIGRSGIEPPPHAEGGAADYIPGGWKQSEHSPILRRLREDFWT